MMSSAIIQTTFYSELQYADDENLHLIHLEEEHSGVHKFNEFNRFSSKDCNLLGK